MSETKSPYTPQDKDKGVTRADAHGLDAVGKNIFTSNVELMPFKLISLSNDFITDYNSAIILVNRNDIVPKNSHLDVIFDILSTSETKLLTNYSPNTVYSHIIAFESEKKARNTAKHINYIADLLSEHYSTSNRPISIDFTIIYAPQVSPMPVIPSKFGCFTFNPQVIYLRDTNKEDLFIIIDGKIKSFEKLTRLQLLQLFMLPESMLFSNYKFKDNEFFDLLLTCMEYGSNRELSSDDLALGFSWQFVDYYTKYLNKEQVDKLSGRSKMGIYSDAYGEKRHQDGFQQGRREERRETVIPAVLALLNEGVDRRTVRSAFKISEDRLKEIEADQKNNSRPETGASPESPVKGVRKPRSKGTRG